MAANPLENFIDQEKIAGFIEAVNNDSSLEQQFVHPAINVIQDEHVRKVYVLMVLFAASAFMRSGIDDKSLFSKAFAVAKAISPNPLDAGEMKELMQQSITKAANNINQYAQDLRQHDLTLPLLFHFFHMADGAMNSEIEKRLLQFAEKFDMAATMQDVLNGSTSQERAAIFDAKLNEQKLVQDDAKRAEVRARGRQLEESLNSASPRKRYTELYLFYKENNFREDMLNNSDALYRLELEENNLSDAIQWLRKSIELNDSPERREQLMELYQRQSLLLKKECPSEENTTSNSRISGCGTLIILILLVLGGMGCFLASSNSSEDSLKEESKQIVEEKANIKETKPDYIKSQKTDLSLGGVDIGIDVIKLHEILGPEKAEEKNGTRIILKYDHIDVELQEGKVYSVVSNNGDALTLRGIHQGSTLQDITSAYGAAVSSFDSGNLSMLEYKFNSLDNRDGILRFAVNKSNNTVDYISVRISDLLSTPSIPGNTENAIQEKTRATSDLPQATQTSKTKAVYVYKRFTDDACGFSFDYPDVGQELKQQPGDNKYYIISLRAKAEIIFGSQPTNYSSLEEASHKIHPLVPPDANIKWLDDVTYIVTRDNKDRDHIWEKNIYVIQNGNVHRRYIRAIKSGSFQDYSDIEEAYQHLIESFQP